MSHRHLLGAGDPNLGHYKLVQQEFCPLCHLHVKYIISGYLSCECGMCTRASARQWLYKILTSFFPAENSVAKSLLCSDIECCSKIKVFLFLLSMALLFIFFFYLFWPLVSLTLVMLYYLSFMSIFSYTHILLFEGGVEIVYVCVSMHDSVCVCCMYADALGGQNWGCWIPWTR